MKKYDFLLLGLYCLPVLVLVTGMWAYNREYVNQNKKGIDYVTEMYLKPVTHVLIQDTG